ncbi:hypothetical protein BGX21_007924 [Mortierella sp. AD011]|nr:hypothetical protein BGX20_007011 [Mortierella sp. AD010]KAF9398328.1 hypothetical protein BGX21_007924 [Mortierella sp. AD011]
MRTFIDWITESGNHERPNNKNADSERKPRDIKRRRQLNHDHETETSSSSSDEDEDEVEENDEENDEVDECDENSKVDRSDDNTGSRNNISTAGVMMGNGGGHASERRKIDPELQKIGVTGENCGQPSQAKTTGSKSARRD